jgi:enolase
VTIRKVEAGWILDSRGDPTVEVNVVLADGTSHRASAPSGASKGIHERPESRDRESPRWRGLGVESAIGSVRGEVSETLGGVDETDQRRVDDALRSLPGLGANAMVAVSAAVARSGAAAEGRPLWAHLSRGGAALPLPMVNLFSGNLHAAKGMSIQDVLVVPLGAPSYEAALECIYEVYRCAGDLLRASGRATAVGDEGGYASTDLDSRAVIELTVAAIAAAGFDPGRDVSLALDIAATHFFDGAHYRLDGTQLSADSLADVLVDWCHEFPIVSIEDPFAEDDWSAWSEFSSREEAQSLQVLGDDLIATHLDRLDRAQREGAANSVLVKANQVGTITDALDVAERARQHGMRAVVSARSGETEDDWLADLAVAAGSGQIKIGSLVRSERLAKYNRLLRIGRESDLNYAGGGDALPGWA